MKKAEAFPSRFISSGDITDPVMVTIESLVKEEITGEKGPEEVIVMYFRDKKKGFILKPTNWNTIEAVYGDDSDLWLGKQIILYFDPNITFGRKRTGGIRVRMPEAADGQAPPPGMVTGSGRAPQESGTFAHNLEPLMPDPGPEPVEETEDTF